jgi:hypothetical protein
MTFSMSENLTFLDVAKQNLTLLEQLLKSQALLQAQSAELLGSINQRLINLEYLVNGFTGGGASFNGYIPDAFTSSYLAILGPLLAGKLAEEDIPLEEYIKGATILARRTLEELAAYRSEQGGRDYIDDQAELINNPWDEQDHASEPN